MTDMKMAVVSESERTTVMIHRQTKDDLDSIKRPGQSYDGVIQDLLEFWKQKKRERWMRRKEEQKVPVG